MSLSAFSPPVREWFQRAFADPTPAQARAWPAIASGEHVLISAPTGSGKTLAAFLWALDRLTVDGSGANASAGRPESARPGARRAGPGVGAGRGGAKSRTRLVYVSPLKALSYDIERNLRAPLRGIARPRDGADPPGADIRVAIRTGDTPQRERAAMLREPPDILITTPESLYLMLTSRAREMLRGAEWVIVDEIHAVASTKRGAHLALTLERLDALVGEAGGGEPQRIGLSATQRPLEEVARFLVGPQRKCQIVDLTCPPTPRKELDVKIHVPVESMTELDAGPVPGVDPLEPTAGGESSADARPSGSIWPAIYPELLRLIREHRSTIVFVNNRRSAERLALRLNELAAADRTPDGEAAGAGAPDEAPAGEAGSSIIARAHHGSLAREERQVVEELLKAGEIPCIVATSSLELGIDMGAVDLVLQVESPKSVAAGLQRIGRAGHNVGDVSKGRIFPKFRADLLECAVVVRRMREGAIESTVVPRNPLDVLAQQIVAMAAALQEDEPPLSVDDLYALLGRTYTYAELPRRQLENVLDMLDGRWAGGPSSNFADLRPRIVWDRVAGTIRARKGARGLAVANAGTIPDRGLYLVTLPDGRRVGELDEEMVYEARPGQVFLLGASSWRIEEIGRDRVVVTPAPGAPGAVPFWKGDGLGRPKELGEAIGAFSRWAVEQDAETLEREYDLDRRAARNLLDYLQEQQRATRVVPSDRTVVVERFRDEIGDWRLCVLSPYGGRIHAAWGLALAARIRDELGLEADAIWSDDGIVVHLPDADGHLPDAEEIGDGRDPNPIDRRGGLAFDPADLVMIAPDELEDLVVAELSGSALFGARFREAAARALLIPRAYPGRRTPLWQQRLKSQTLLEVAQRYDDFPIVLEAYRECLRDVLDLPGLRDLLAKLQRRELSLVEVETATASPFASSLLFDYVATYMYEGDAPNAERRAAALSLDRDLLRELLGQEELRELIDAGALERLEDDLQRRSRHTRAATRDELHDTLRRVGDMTSSEVAERVLEGVDGRALLGVLERERRAIRVRVGGEERFVDAADAGLYRDALGAVPPGGLPDAFLADVPDALVALLRRYAATHGPFPTAAAAARYGLAAGALEPALRELERSGALVRGELHPNPAPLPSHAGGDRREWCDVEVLRRLRRASLAALRREIEPAERRAFAAFLPAWHGIDRHAAAGAGVERLREQLVPLQGLALTPRTWEREVLPRRVGAYSPAWMDELCASGELVWVGAGSLGRNDGRVALYFREDVALLGPPPPRRGEAGRAQAARGGARHGEAGPGGPGGPEDGARACVRARLDASPCFFTDLVADLELAPEELREALWDLVWAGEATSDAFAPLRAPRLTLAANTARDAAAAHGLPSARPSSVRSPRARGIAPRFSARRGAGRAPSHPPGRWSLTAPLFAGAGEQPGTRAGGQGTGGQAGGQGTGGQSGHRRALAELLLERHGILTRELVLAEGVPGGFAALYPELCRLETLGAARRGYFVEGLGGAQFALPGAVERLRAQRPERDAGRALVLAATDPAQPYGAALPWPEPRRGPAPNAERPSAERPSAERSSTERSSAVRRPARVPGAAVVLVGAEPVLYLERGGRALQTFADPDDERVGVALAALAEHARAGRLATRLALERADGRPLLGTAWEAALARVGFHAGPRRLTLGA
jgi:ATP-dependent helicase Lhr and Lhr-like helicase